MPSHWLTRAIQPSPHIYQSPSYSSKSYHIRNVPRARRDTNWRKMPRPAPKSVVACFLASSLLWALLPLSLFMLEAWRNSCPCLLTKGPRLNPLPVVWIWFICALVVHHRANIYRYWTFQKRFELELLGTTTRTVWLVLNVANVSSSWLCYILVNVARARRCFSKNSIGSIGSLGISGSVASRLSLKWTFK